MQRIRSRARLVTALLLILTLVPSQLVLGTRSGKASKGSLNRKLHQVNSQINNVQSLIHKKKIEGKYAKLDLLEAQRKLEIAQDSVTRNKFSLLKSQYELNVINRRLDRNQRQLQRRGKLLSRRLVDIYEGDDIGYLDVMLGSKDMQTFMSRGYYVKQIVTSDVTLIKEFKKAKAEIEADKRKQAAEVRRVAQLQSDLIDQRDEVSALEDAKQSRLQEIEHDKTLYEKQLAALLAESEQIAESIQRLQATPRGQRRYSHPFNGSLGLPVNGRISCRFGYRIHPITGAHSLHTGVDIACPTGTPVHSAASGEVILAGWMGAYGNAVVIDHGGGVSTLYGHNSRVLVRVGQQVGRGQVIARSGSTGWSTGPHCHFEKRVNGRPINPL